MIDKVISGGQYGADENGLFAARDSGIETGGTAPKGYKVVNPDGSIGYNPSLANLGLVEHPSSQFPPRTEQNIKDADVTLLFGNPKSRGGRLASRLAVKLGKPLIEINMGTDIVALVKNFKESNWQVVNVAGNRQVGDDTKLGNFVYKFMTLLIKCVNV